jgi:hypothetical protein
MNKADVGHLDAPSDESGADLPGSIEFEGGPYLLATPPRYPEPRQD